MTEIHAAEAADSLNPVAHVRAGEHIVPAELGNAVTGTVDVTAKLDAGTALFYAIYHSGADAVLALPDPVKRAYAAACHAFDPNGYRR